MMLLDCLRCSDGFLVMGSFTSERNPKYSFPLGSTCLPANRQGQNLCYTAMGASLKNL
jgi:hypothetical protein